MTGYCSFCGMSRYRGHYETCHFFTQGIEAGTAETLGSVHESPVGGNADAPQATDNITQFTHREK